MVNMSSQRHIFVEFNDFEPVTLASRGNGCGIGDSDVVVFDVVRLYSFEAAGGKLRSAGRAGTSLQGLMREYPDNFFVEEGLIFGRTVPL
jgi:hypothetical protein